MQRLRLLAAAALVVAAAAVVYGLHRTRPVHLGVAHPPAASRRHRHPPVPPHRRVAKPVGPPAVAVVVENSPAARPESGLASARLVFEAPAEGGITRFLAVFWGVSVPQIGPVRSTRIYFDQLAQAYRLPLAHAGGNRDALRAIAPLGIQNLDEIWTPHAAPYFWRASDRPAPHNLYTSTRLLRLAVGRLGLRPGRAPVWPVGLPPGGTPTHQVAITYADDPGVFVERPIWIDRNGMYLRTEDGAPDPTLRGRSIRARGVLVLITPESPDPDPYTPGSIKLAMTGSGRGWLVAGGRRWPIRWQRQAGQPFTFLQADGRPLPLPAPPLWVELVPWSSAVSFR